MQQLPEFIRPWTAPFHVALGGDVKDSNGCWICHAGQSAHKLVELMNYAAIMAETYILPSPDELEKMADRELAGLHKEWPHHQEQARRNSNRLHQMAQILRVGPSASGAPTR